MQNTLNPIETFHNEIHKGDLCEIKRSLTRLVHDKYLYNANGESAVATALKCGRCDIYELLISKGIRMGPHEQMDEIVSQHPQRKKRKLSEIHKTYVINPNQKHLTTLILKSMLSHDTSVAQRREFLELIAKAYEDLNESAWIEPILKIVSTDSRLNVVFDFQRDSVCHMDPTKNKYVSGTTYSNESYILIGAKGLTIREEQNQVLGTLSHELCHHAMQLVYKNNCEPYHSHDDKKQEAYRDVMMLCESKKNSEDLIKEVFECYPPEKYLAELIVRVPHISAVYKDDTERYMEVSSEFYEVFDFYEENTLTDFKSEYPRLDALNDVQELNELCGVQAYLKQSELIINPNEFKISFDANDKMIQLSSNCPKITMSSIFQQYKSSSPLVFINLKHFENPKIFYLIIKAFQLCVNPTMIIDCDKRKQSEVSNLTQKLMDKNMKTRTVLVTTDSVECSSVMKMPLVHSWSHLTLESHEKLMKKIINFQEKAMRLENLIDANSTQVFNAIPIEDILTNEIITFARETKFGDVSFFVERKFLLQNLDEIWNVDADNKLTFDEVVTLIKDVKIILLFDEPGAGKSTEFKMIASRLKEKFPAYWIVLMDLKEHFKVYQKDEKISYHFNDAEHITIFLCDKIMKLKNFEASMFTHFFDDNRVVILMDGFDEICPSYKRFIMNLMIGIKQQSRNQLWISSRPHLVEELQEELGDLFAIKLQPFSRDNRKEFFAKCFDNSEDGESKLNEIENFLTSLVNNSWLSDSFSNPLLLKMIAELFEEDENFELSMSSMFSVYDHFTMKIVEKCMDKGPEARKNIVNSCGNSRVVEFYQTNAFHTMFRRFDVNDVIVSVRKLCQISFKTTAVPSVDDIIRAGLMYSDGSGSFHFIHRTFAEFFVAKFIFETIFLQRFRNNEKLEACMEVLGLVLIKEYWYKMIKIFLDNAVQSLEASDLCANDSLSLCASKVLKAANYRSFMHDLIADGCWNLIRTVSNLLLQNSSTVWLEKHHNGNNVLMTAARYQSINFEKVWLFLSGILEVDVLKMMLTDLNRNHQNTFHVALEYKNVNIFQFLLKKAENLLNKELLQDCLTSTDNRGFTVFHHALDCPGDFGMIYELIKENICLNLMKTFLTAKCEEGNDLKTFAKEYNIDSDNYKYLCNILDNP